MGLVWKQHDLLHVACRLDSNPVRQLRKRPNSSVHQPELSARLRRFGQRGFDVLGTKSQGAVGPWQHDTSVHAGRRQQRQFDSPGSDSRDAGGSCQRRLPTDVGLDVAPTQRWSVRCWRCRPLDGWCFVDVQPDERPDFRLHGLAGAQSRRHGRVRRPFVSLHGSFLLDHLV